MLIVLSVCTIFYLDCKQSNNPVSFIELFDVSTKNFTALTVIWSQTHYINKNKIEVFFLYYKNANK